MRLLGLSLGLCLRLSLCLRGSGLLGLDGGGRLRCARGDTRGERERRCGRAHRRGNVGRRDRRGRKVCVAESRVGVEPAVRVELEQVLQQLDGCVSAGIRLSELTIARRLGDNRVEGLLGMLAQRLLELDLGLAG